MAPRSSLHDSYMASKYKYKHFMIGDVFSILWETSVILNE